MIDSKEILNAFNWRYAVKAFDPERLVGEEDKGVLLESIRLTATSFGLQPFRVFVIRDKERQNELQAASFNQPQVGTASDLIVFAAKTNIDEAYINEFIALTAETRGVDVATLEEYRQMMAGMLGGMSAGPQKEWAQKQAYIALGSLLEAAALMKIDSCPMEGFDVGAYDEALGLAELGFTTTLLCPIGYRVAGDELMQKVRFGASDFFLSA